MEAILKSKSNNEIRHLGAFEKRVHEVDFLRGILMILVILDHLFLRLWQLGLSAGGEDNILYRIFSFYWYSDARSVIRPLVLFGFTFISGISCAFSKSNKKRAGLMLIVWAGVLVFTNILQVIVGEGGTRIDFNVIGVLAFSTLIYSLLENGSWKRLGTFALFSIFMAAYFIPFLLTFPNLVEHVYAPILWNPSYINMGWDSLTNSFFFSTSGVTTTGIPQGDHMPLFPYIGFFFAGALVSRFIYREKKSIFKHRFEFERPMCFVGRHALWFYLGHQVVLFPLFTLLEAIL